jgi:uncharacterized protein YeaO (DUF488 family)
MELSIKRVYEAPAETDGTRILVDRLWPRGLSKERAQVDLWLREVAPSDELRHWFDHDPAKWDEFQTRYRDELRSAAAALQQIREHLQQGPVTLLYGAKDEVHNQAVVLQQYLQDSQAP